MTGKRGEIEEIMGLNSWYSRKADLFLENIFQHLKAVIKSLLPLLQNKYIENQAHNLCLLQGKTPPWTLNWL